MSFEHGRDVCGGAAWCAACNARMIVLEGTALREAVSEAIHGERRSSNPDPEERVIARVERYWRDSKRFRDRYRERVLDWTTIRMTG
jgi:hypothetical protein